MEAYFPITDSIQGIQDVSFKAVDVSGAGSGFMNIEWWALVP